ncbi:universal stress protein [Chitinophaga rhizosphaerae]|uniref:universal stress protein n=1 Tax=Chitinophaga rhizosphaerae TaxID=1864947 RepID=UPI000F7FB826|nr:universal stress protein [Chitinophaga rhizosphaerae]
MKRILVPTDFSPTAEKAFRFALDLAQRSNGSIILYHACTPVESIFVGTAETRNEYNTKSKIDTLKRLQRLRKKVAAGSPGVAVSTIVGRSPFIDKLLEFVIDHHIDLIVMGTQGCSGLKKTIIGSEAARVVERVDRPVLLVPGSYEFKELGRFVFATDFLQTDKAALATVSEMAKLYKADINLLHFQNAYNTPVDKLREKNDFDTYAHNLQRELNAYKIEAHLLEAGSVTATMETLDKKFPHDILVMVRRKKTFLEKFFVKSFTRNMSFVTKKPLLVIPE